MYYLKFNELGLLSEITIQKKAGGPTVEYDKPFDSSNKTLKINEDTGEIVEISFDERLEIERNSKSILELSYGIAEVKNSDYSLHLTKGNCEYDRGRKKASYYLDDKSNVAVKKEYSYKYVDGGLNIINTINWYNFNGDVVETKVMINKSLDSVTLRDFEAKCRSNAINFLVSESKGTPLQTIFEFITDKYKDEISSYLSYEGSNSLELAIQNESDQQSLSILNTLVPYTLDPTKKISVKNAILFQINGISEEYLNNVLI